MGHYKNNKCRICDSENIIVVLQLEASPLADGFVTKEQLGIEQNVYDMDVYKCQECGLVQLVDVVEPEDIYTDYLYRTNTSIGLPEHFVKAAESIVSKYAIKTNSLVLDIGSNDGSLLKGFKKQGMRVLGIDPAKEVAKEATLSGVETLADFFNASLATRLVQKYGKATIITCNNAIANIDNLNDFVKGIKNILDSGGIFVSETSYLLSLMESMVFDTIYHEHLSYFGIKPLEYLFNNNGLKLFDAEIIETKGGSLRYAVAHAEENRAETESLIQLKQIENKRKLYETHIYKEFDRNINKAKNELTEFIDNALKEGKQVVGYGASNTTTTLLYHFEINDKIKYIVDDNIIKIGRFSPHKHIPIYGTNKLYENAPDIVIVFAWRFADMIIAKHQRYIEEGGTFVVPLPILKMVNKWIK